MPVPRILIALGVALVVVGLLWPWLGKLPLGRLPGDLTVERQNFRAYFPFTTMLLASIVVSLLVWLFRR